MIRSGFGLEPFTTETGEEIWRENGVEYREFPYREPGNNTFYTSSFEPNIPFKEEEFFEGRKEKIAQFK